MVPQLTGNYVLITNSFLCMFKLLVIYNWKCIISISGSLQHWQSDVHSHQLSARDAGNRHHEPKHQGNSSQK
jgi:hypothetical protein